MFKLFFYTSLVLTVIVILETGLVSLVHRNEIIEGFIEGTPRCLIADGRLVLESLRNEVLSRDELFARLREAGVEQIGAIKRAYLEGSGHLSLFLYPPREVRPGLSLIPPWELGKPETFASGTLAPGEVYYACCACGETIHCTADNLILPYCVCEGSEWTRATKNPLQDILSTINECTPSTNRQSRS